MSAQGCDGFLHKASVSIDGAIASFFRWEGRLIARFPYSTIILSVLLTVFLGFMCVRNFDQETRATELYVPLGSSTTADLERVRDAFGFFPFTETLLVYSKKGSDTNLLEAPRENLEELMSMWESMEQQNLGVPFSDYKSVCAKSGAGMPCKAMTLLAFWDFNRTTLDNDPDPLGTINSVSPTDTYGNKISIEVILGGIERDENGKIFKAAVFSNHFTLETNFRPIELAAFRSLREQGDFAEQEDELKKIDHLLVRGYNPRPFALDEKITALFKGWEDRSDTKLIARMTHLSLVTVEADGAINEDLVWMLLSVVLVGGYCHIVLFRNNWVHCKVHLVTATMTAIVMAIVASIGLALTFGVKINLVVMAVPFLILGLGIDDTFIILGQYRNANPSDTPAERVAFTLSKSGPSILVTSVTDLIAFTLSMFSTMPALHAFGVYASLGVAFDFLFQVTFFVAFLALEARREDRLAQGGRLLGILSAKRTKADGKGCTEAIELSARDASATEKGHPSEAAEVPLAQRRIWGQGIFDHTVPSFTTQVVGKWIPSMTLTAWGTTVVVVIEIMLLVASVYGCTQITMDFRYREWFPPKTSWLHDGYRLEHEHFFGEQDLVKVYTTEGSHFYNQEQMMDCVFDFEQSPYISPLPESRSWFKEYVAWSRRLRRANLTDDGWAIDSDTFTNLVDEFLNSPEGEYYLDDVKINKTQNRISSTILFTGFSKNIKSASYGISLMNDARQRAADTVPLLSPAVVSQMFPFYEGLAIVVKDSVQNLLLAALAVVIVISVILAKLMAALVVSLVVVLTDVMLLGLMWYAGLTFNMVTSICIVLAVGIAVDYSVHIAHSFLSQQGTKKERAAAALHAIGGDVFSGAFTSWLAIIGIALTTTYVLQVFFKMLTLLIVLGAWHGIVVLPILLAYFGPSSYADAA